MKTIMRKLFGSLAVLALLIVCGILLPLQTQATAAMAENEEEPFGITWDSFPVYTGNELTPTPIVTYQNNVLQVNKDYVIYYLCNIDAGHTAEVAILGRGDYLGMSMRSCFSILPADIEKVASFDLSSSATYTGFPVMPDNISVTGVDGKTLVEGVDYQVIYLNNVQPGDATARFIGIGNYTGFYDATYKVLEATTLPIEDDFVIDLNNANAYSNQTYVASANYMVTFVNSQDSSKYSFYIDGERQSWLDSDCTTVAMYLKPGRHEMKYTYTETYRSCGYQYDEDGVVRWVCKEHTSYNRISWCVDVINVTPFKPETLTAAPPIFQGANKIYLEVVGDTDEGVAYTDVGKPVWKSSNPEIATVEDGIVTIHKAGSAIITATVGDLTATWELDDIAALTLSKNTKILHFDPTTDKATVVWKNELLVEGKDYCIETKENDDKIIVTIVGINSFCDSITTVYYADTGYPYIYYGIPGDIDGNEAVTQDDAVYLLLHTMFGEAFYPLDGAEGDIDGNGSVNQEDAVYLLLHTMFGETFYPLNTPAMPAKIKE